MVIIMEFILFTNRGNHIAKRNPLDQTTGASVLSLSCVQLAYDHMFIYMIIITQVKRESERYF